MTVDRMRAEIAKVYNAPRWIARVQAMPDNQVIAIYHKFLKVGKFDKPRHLRKKEEYEQLTIFDYTTKGE